MPASSIRPPRPARIVATHTLALAAGIGGALLAASRTERDGAVFRWPQPGQAADLRGYALANVRVIDADTLEADVLLPWGVTLSQRELRAADYDAWETSRRRRTVEVTNEEIARGKAAAADLRKLLATATLWATPAAEEADAYGRLLAILTVRPAQGQPESLAAWMHARGHCRE